MARNIGPGLAQLLDGAHKKYEHGLRIETEMLQMPTANNDMLAVFKATVTGIRVVNVNEQESAAEEKFTGHGEASPSEAGAKRGTPAHDTPMRMAESRSIVRALRWATNVGETAEEEMPYGGDSAPEPRKQQGIPKGPDKWGQQQKAAAQPTQGSADNTGGNEPSEPMMRFIQKLIESKFDGDTEAFEKLYGSSDSLTFQNARKAITEMKEMKDV